MTRLFTFDVPVSLPDQLTVLAEHLSPQERKVFSSIDRLLFNADVDQQTFIPISIEMVRLFQTEVLRTPMVGELRQIILGNIELASVPAQHALLKIIEEPPQQVQILITAQGVECVLPTVLSRCEVIHTQYSPQTEPIQLPQLLLKLTANPDYTCTLHEVFALSEQYKERAAAKTLIEAVLVSLHQQPPFPTEQKRQCIQATLTALKQLDSNVNVRLIIEHLLFKLNNTPLRLT